MSRFTKQRKNWPKTNAFQSIIMSFTTLIKVLIVFYSITVSFCTKSCKIHLGQSHRCKKRKNKKIQYNKIICYLMGSSNFGKSHGNYYRIQVKLKSKFIISSVRLLTNLLKLIHWSSDLARQTVWPFSL